MSIQVNDKNLGHATAYAYAVAGGYTGTEAEFTELLGNIADDLGQIENLTVTVETLAAGSSATASYSNGVLHLGIPKGDKGDKGDTGATGPTGPTGNGIASVAKTGTSGLVDTYTITYTNGNTSTFTVTNGAEAVDNTLTIAGRAADAKKTGDEISELKEELSKFSNALEDGKLEYANNPVNGVESSSTGNVSSSETRLLIQSKLKADSPITVKVNGQKVFPHYWRKNGDGFAYSLHGSKWYTEDFELPQSEFYFDFVIAKTDDSNISPSECYVSITKDRLLTVEKEKSFSKINNRVDTLFKSVDLREVVWSDADHKCLNTNGDTIDISNPTDSSSIFRYAVVPCAVGDKFVVDSIEGTAGARSWAFIKVDGTIISKCESLEILPRTVLVAPSGSAYAVFNDINNGTVFSGSPITTVSDNLIRLTNTTERDIIENGSVALHVSFPDRSTVVVNGTSVAEHPLYLNGSSYLDTEIFTSGDYFYSKFTSGEATSELSLRLCDIEASNFGAIPSGTRLHFDNSQRGALIIPAGTYVNYKTQLMFVKDTYEPKCYNPYGNKSVNDPYAREAAELNTDLNEWQANVIARSEQICRISYNTTNDGFPYPPATTPDVSNLPAIGTKITGLPYSSSRTGAKLVGIDARFDTYLSCVVDPNSVLYNKYVDPISSGGARAYYGQVCSSVVGYILNLKHYMSTGVMKNWNGVRKINPQDIEVGDIVLTASGTVRDGDTPARTEAGHATVVTGVRKDRYGRIEKVRWCEGTIPVSKFHPWEDFEKFLDTENGAIGGGAGGGLKNRDCLYRLTNRNEIPYDKIDAINCFDETANLKIEVPAVICNYGDKAVISNTETDIAIDAVKDIASATLTYSNGTTKTYGSASAGTILDVLSDVPSGRHIIESVYPGGGKTYSDFVVVNLSDCSYDEDTKVLTLPSSSNTYDIKLWEVNAMDSNGGHQKIINVEGLPSSVDCTSLYVLNDGNPQSFIYTDVAHEFVSIKAIFRIECDGNFYGNAAWEHTLNNPAVEIKPTKNPVKALIRALKDGGTITEEQFRLIDSQID